MRWMRWVSPYADYSRRLGLRGDGGRLPCLSEAIINIGVLVWCTCVDGGHLEYVHIYIYIYIYTYIYTRLKKLTYCVYFEFKG